jgi:hypothetical protein
MHGEQLLAEIQSFKLETADPYNPDFDDSDF